MRVLLVGLLALVPAITSLGAERPPNLVLVMADDVGYECFGAYGSRQYATPRINKLADGGVRFTNCYSTPLCTPSRVALMTGMSNARNYADFGVLLPDQYTIADLFREAGYATAVAGKWQLQGSQNAPGVPAGDGFDSYCLWNTGNTERRRFWNPSIECDGKIIDVSEDDYGPDIFTDFLLEFIEAQQDQPFFAYYPMALVHSPFLPTPHSSDRSSKDEQRNFEDMVAYTDFIVGRLQDRLESLGLLRNTVFVFTSDNGTHHTLASQLGGASILGDKGAPTDAGTHVPLVVNAPGLIKGGRVLDDLIDFADFLPTFAEAAGLGLPETIEPDGVSFWPRLLGQPGQPREWLYTYYFPRPFAEEFVSPYTNPEVVYVRDKRYKLYRSGELFDLRADPDEISPLGDAVPGLNSVRDKLQSALDSMPAAGERIPPERGAASRTAARPRWR
ncbi:MAG: sulfatase-like hydrolase/transferase [Bryobacterales bacterium]|nr:sulfatase-like hydrolase/transferase [Bryobacterales bacterium]